MSSHEEKAMELFKEGYNCAQAVLGAFTDELGMDKQTAMKLSSSFGGGMGRMREVCGAVSGMFMVAGIKSGYDNPKDPLSRAKHYKLIQDMAAEYKKYNGSIICRELLQLENSNKPEDPAPAPRTEEYYKKRPCVELVGMAARIADQFVFSDSNA